jgi:hypothetical protein
VTRELTPDQVARIRADVRALPPMPPDALTRIAVLFASLDAQHRRRAVEARTGRAGRGAAA